MFLFDSWRRRFSLQEKHAFSTFLCHFNGETVKLYINKKAVTGLYFRSFKSTFIYIVVFVINIFMVPPGLLCCFWPPSWLKPTRPPVVSPGLPDRPELRARTASVPTSDGWQTTCRPSGSQARTSAFSPRQTSSTSPWRSVSRFSSFSFHPVSSWCLWRGGLRYFPCSVSLFVSEDQLTAAPACCSKTSLSLHFAVKTGF